MATVSTPTDTSAKTPTREHNTAATSTPTPAPTAKLELSQLNSQRSSIPEPVHALDFSRLLAAVEATEDQFEASDDAHSDRDVDNAINTVIEAANSAPLPRWFIGQAPTFDWTEGTCRRIYWRAVGSVEIVGDDVVTPEGVIRRPATISLNGNTDELDTNTVQLLVADLQAAVQILNATADKHDDVMSDRDAVTCASEVE